MGRVKNILFVCHGNICRSPMAEFIMKDILAKAGLEGQIHVESAAVSSEEIGNPVYGPARRELEKHGITCHGKVARKMTAQDYDKFDIILAMDNSNLYNLKRICGDPLGKVKLFLEYAGRPNSEVSDPWYTGDFAKAYSDISEACEGLLKSLQAGKKL